MTAETYNFSDTVYVRNINEKVSLNTLKSKLLELFEKYGPVLSITAHKNLKMRGQAFVALEGEENAKQAIEELNGTQLFEQKIELTFAKSSSNASVESKIAGKDYEEYLNKRKIHKEEEDKKREQQPAKRPKVKVENLPPNKLLLVQGLPKDITRDELVDIFDKYNGFVEVRLVAVRGVAFVEYERDEDAIPVKEKLSNLTIRDSKPIVNYAKK